MQFQYHTLGPIYYVLFVLLRTLFLYNILFIAMIVVCTSFIHDVVCPVSSSKAELISFGSYKSKC